MNRVRVVLPDSAGPIPAQECKPGTVYRRASPTFCVGDYYLCISVRDSHRRQFVNLSSRSTWTPYEFEDSTYHEVGALELE